MLKEIIKSMRPSQWVKNAVVFAPLLFSGSASEPEAWAAAAYAFFVFCLLSGSVYLMNDLLDREEDRRHPLKRNRPVASGSLAPHQGLFGVLALFCLSLLGAFLFNTSLGIIAGSYLVLNLCYSKILKKLILLDVLAIAVGFVLRALAGAVVIPVEITFWLVLLTFLLALFLALSKRRQQLSAASGRSLYTARQLNWGIGFVTVALIAVYSLYAKTALLLTLPFVFYGLFRYLHLVYKMSVSESPTDIILTDQPLLLNLGLWLLAVVLLTY